MPPTRSRARYALAVALVALLPALPAAPAAADPELVPIEAPAPAPVGRAGSYGQMYVANSVPATGVDYSFAYLDDTNDVITGDWDGNGRTGFASRRGNVFTLSDEKGYPAGSAGYGKATDRLVIGDWDGNGSDTFGVRRGNQYFLRNSATTGVADIVLAYGQAVDELFVGDWNGDGIDSFAVRRGNVFYVRNSSTTGVADVVFAYGRAGDQTHVGDWDGNGTDTFAVRRGSEFFVRNDFRTGVAQVTFSFGVPDDRALVGDFDGDGDDSFALLRNVNGPLPAAHTVVGQNHSKFAGTAGINLVHPSTRVELIGFHESGHDGSKQLAIAPTAVANTTLPTRYRGTGSRSAADIVVEPQTTIRSPVSGTVLSSGTYVLYCQYSDDYLYIAPDAQPTWEVRIFHIDGVQVHAGDRLKAGVTVIAPRATQLPFASQVDDYTGEPSWPHVHIEIVDPSIPDRSSGSC